MPSTTSTARRSACPRRSRPRRAAVARRLQERRERRTHRRRPDVDRHVARRRQPRARRPRFAARAATCSVAMPTAFESQNAGVAVQRPVRQLRSRAPRSDARRNSKPAGRAGCRARAALSRPGAPRRAAARARRKLCQRPSMLTKRARGLGERRDRQQHVRVLQRRCRTASARPRSPLPSSACARRGSAQSSSGSSRRAARRLFASQRTCPRRSGRRLRGCRRRDAATHPRGTRRRHCRRQEKPELRAQSASASAPATSAQVRDAGCCCATLPSKIAASVPSC